MSKEKARKTSIGKSGATKKDKATLDKKKDPSFGREIANFVLSVESLSRANEQTMKVVTSSLKKTSDAFTSFFKEKGISRTKADGKTSFQLRPNDATSFQKHIKELHASHLAVQKIPSIFFCSLVHQYDAYLGKLLRVSFFVKPEMLHSSQKQLSFAELMSLGSLDIAREYLIEKEIETILRGSHDDQFTWMENRFALPLRKDLQIWPNFIEMTERRHLFVHCDGTVSSQYLSICGKHNVNVDAKLAVGQQLGVNKTYFEHSVDCILEIGVKLGHVLWRKLQSDQLEQADLALHLTTYDFLLEERYSLAKTLLHFAANSLKKHSSEEIRRMLFVNLAIAHYYLGEKQEAHKILDSHDWTACTDKFKLAVAVLHDNFKDAENIMKKIGKKGDIGREDYSTWPLFRDFRKSKEFLRTYRKLFGKEFIVPGEVKEQNLKIDKTSQQDSLGGGE